MATDKTRVELWMVAGLLGLFSVLALKGVKDMRALGFRRPAPPPSIPQRLDPVATQTTPGPQETPADQEERAAAYTAQGLRDPFQSLLPGQAVEEARLPSTAPEGAPAPGGAAVAEGGMLTAPPASVASQGPALPLRLQGIMWGGGRPKALINDKVYGVGEAVDGGTIVAIDRHGVTVESGGSRVVYSASGAPGPMGSQQGTWWR